MAIKQTKIRIPRLPIITWLGLLGLILLTCYYFWGIQFVPFHPDESTHIFMSSDLDLLLTDPIALTNKNGDKENIRANYRKLDAPLTRYLIGIGRNISGIPAPENDWDWSKSWTENIQAGALPDEPLLKTARFSVAILFPFSLILAFLIGKHISNITTGLLTALLLGINALVFLHTRRAMAESVLMFGVCFAILGFIRGDKKPWLAGLGMALAYNAKQSALALFPVGVLAVLWSSSVIKHHKLRLLTWRLFQYLSIFFIITMLLNPFMWSNPYGAVQKSWTARQELLDRQLGSMEQLAPEQALLTPGRRFAVLIANLFITQPAFSEVGNYRDQTFASEEKYLSLPFHNLARDAISGGIFLLLTLSGIVLSVLQAYRTDLRKRRTVTLLFVATFSVLIALIATVPLPWQRYILILVPMGCIWSAFAITYPYYKRRESSEFIRDN